MLVTIKCATANLAGTEYSRGEYEITRKEEIEAVKSLKLSCPTFVDYEEVKEVKEDKPKKAKKPIIKADNI